MANPSTRIMPACTWPMMAAPLRAQFEHVAVLEQEDVLGGDAGGPGQFGVKVHVAMLAVDRA